MKVYISLPITGHDIEEVEARCIFAKAVLERKGHTPVSPLDVSDNPENQKAAGWNTLLPKSITN